MIRPVVRIAAAERGHLERRRAPSRICAANRQTRAYPFQPAGLRRIRHEEGLVAAFWKQCWIPSPIADDQHAFRQHTRGRHGGTSLTKQDTSRGKR